MTTEITLDDIKDLVLVQILSYIAAGETKKKACALMNVSESTFDRAFKNKPDVVSEFYAQERNRIERLYVDLNKAREKLIIDLIGDAEHPGDLKTSEKLALEKRLTEITSRLEASLKLVTPEEDDLPPDPFDKREELAKRFVSNVVGPKLRKATSITTLEFDTGEEEVIDVIDA